MISRKAESGLRFFRNISALFSVGSYCNYHFVLYIEYSGWVTWGQFKVAGLETLTYTFGFD